MQFRDWFNENYDSKLFEATPPPLPRRKGFLGRIGSMLGADNPDSWASAAADKAKYTFGGGQGQTWDAYRAQQQAGRRTQAQQDTQQLRQSQIAGTKDDPANQSARAAAIENTVKDTIFNGYLKGMLGTFKPSQRRILDSNITNIANTFATGKGGQVAPAMAIAKAIYDNPEIDQATKETYFDGPSPVYLIFHQTIRSNPDLWYDKDANEPFPPMDFNAEELTAGMSQFARYKELRKQAQSAGGTSDPDDFSKSGEGYDKKISIADKMLEELDDDQERGSLSTDWTLPLLLQMWKRRAKQLTSAKMKYFGLDEDGADGRDDYDKLTLWYKAYSASGKGKKKF